MIDEFTRLVQTGSVAELEAFWPLHLQAPLPFPYQDSVWHLHYAVRRTDGNVLEIIAWLKKLDVANRLQYTRNEKHRTPLMEAVVHGEGNPDVIKVLVQWHAEVERAAAEAQRQQKAASSHSHRRSQVCTSWITPTRTSGPP